ncbi:Phosphoenolpyruvate carboxylase 4, variant 2 [Lathyrus oleraceus]|uniref:Phosphoenolpyruvate carboxylase 4, variant 2 n=1 Tax=Pisum sativum TaxID=3888 RepID=A0A9D4YAV5_PEA|nr:Phosphoenolpyruvate carboxylase 4, variant 2 [Pisum sativum]
MTDTTDDIAEEISFQSFDDDCRLLGNLLNDVMQREVGNVFVEKLEKIRILAQSACNMRQAGIEDMADMLEKQLASELSNMTLEEAQTLARAFSHYLTLMATAETHHRVRKGVNMANFAKSCDDIFRQLLQDGISPDDLYNTVCKQAVEIVLTAHPTQINRRTLQYKHIKIAHLLDYNDRPDLGHEDREMVIEDLVREITSIWQTDELRRQKPTPVDEARAGLNIVEQSLWKAVPHYLRRVSNALKKHTGKPLPLTCTPIKFGSWMGGDRDGNPNVTAKVTKDVSLLSRWMAIDLYIREVDSLRFELSMKRCSDKLSRLAHAILEELQILAAAAETKKKASTSNSSTVYSNVKVPLFEGENYDFWAVKMETLFTSLNVLEFVQNRYEDPSPTEAEESSQRLEQLKKKKKIKNAGVLGMIQRARFRHIQKDCRFVNQQHASFAEGENDEVKLGNGEHVEVKGKGNIGVTTKQGSKVIHDTLYVPELDENLLSIGQLLEHGYSLNFENYANHETQRENWNQPESRSQSKHPTASLLPSKLPARAHLPSCAVNGESDQPRLDIPGSDYKQLNHKDGKTSTTKVCNAESSGSHSSPTCSESSNTSSISIPRSPSFNSSQQLLAQRKLYAESHMGRSSFQKLLEPKLPHLPGIAPYRVFLGNVKDKVALYNSTLSNKSNDIQTIGTDYDEVSDNGSDNGGGRNNGIIELQRTRRRLELLLEDCPCEFDYSQYYETTEQLLEPLLICYESMQSCGAGVLADGRLADLIRRVATFGIVLMKLDLRQESGRHVDTLDAITKYLDLGTYSEWDEEKKLDFLTRELKGKRPLVPPSIEVAPDVKEVLDTFRIAAELGSDSLGAYVISMASNASDVLTVELLQKDARLTVSGELGKACPGGT